MNHHKITDFHMTIECREGLELYVRDGIIPGHFLQALICNNLTMAVLRADSWNLGNIPAYVNFLYNDCPAPCWGSEEKMYGWSQSRRDHREREASEATTLPPEEVVDDIQT